MALAYSKKCMSVSGRRQLVAQPGGLRLTLGFLPCIEFLNSFAEHSVEYADACRAVTGALIVAIAVIAGHTDAEVFAATSLTACIQVTHGRVLSTVCRPATLHTRYLNAEY